MQDKQKYKLSIDIGSTKVVGIVYAKKKNNQVQVISKQTLNSKGFKSGNIVNMEDAENCLMNLIYLLETDSKKSFLSVDISISGCGIKSYYIDQKIKIDSHINQENINQLTVSAVKKFNMQEYDLIHSFPIEFTVDNNIVENPINIFCKEFGCKLHIVVAEKHKLKNLANCLAKFNIKIDRFISSSYAAGLSCLSEDAKELGSIIFELGSHTTSFAIFLNNKLVYTNSMPIGSYYITSDISKALSVNLALAEKIKIMYGKINPGNLINQFINFNNFSKNSKEEIDINLTIGDLSQIITPRIEEIIEMIKHKYDELDITHIISKNMYISGGGANLDGIDIAFREHFKYPIQRVRPKLNNEFIKSNYDLQDSVIIGMIMCDNEANKKISSKSLIQKLISWLKNNI
jgi:cell division protein FtsA